MTNEQMKQNEVDIARRFLNIYNRRVGGHFEIVEIREAPDLFCKDSKYKRELGLEIAMFETKEGDIRSWIDLMKGEPTISDLLKGKQTTKLEGYFLGGKYSWGDRGDLENMKENLRQLLRDKLLSSYKGTSTALVVAMPITTGWTCEDLRIYLDDLAKEELSGKELNFPKGIWIFCNADKGSGDGILNLVELINQKLWW